MVAHPEPKWSHPRGPDPLFEFRKIIESLDLHIKNAEHNGPIGGPVEKDFHLIMRDVLMLENIKNRLSPILQQKVGKIQEIFSKANKEGIQSGRFFDTIAEIRKVILTIHNEILKE